MSKAADSSRKVLIADDDPTVRKVMRAALEKDGFEVVDAPDGSAAVQAFDEHAPCLVLLDVEMPVLDGFAACAHIRQRPGGEHVPVVMVTAREDIEAVNDAYRVGATDFIPKPINWPIFGYRIRYTLRTATNYQQLQISETKNDALLNAMPDALLVLAHGGKILDFLAGKSEQSLPAPTEGQVTLSDFLPQSVAAACTLMQQMVERTGEPQQTEFALNGQGGVAYHYEARFLPYLEQQTLVLVSEITKRKRAEERIHRLAYYDTLTGLPNRQFFRQRLEQMIEHARHRGGKVAVLYVDLDNFKRINDTLGHSYGDGVLKAISERLASCIRAQRVDSMQPSLGFARLGGDEFVAALDDVDSEDDVLAVAERIRDVLREPVKFRGHEFVVTPSVGVSLFPDDAGGVEDLLKHADVALYQAKGAGRNSVRFYSGTMSLRSMHRLELETGLRNALANNDLELYYQPKIDLRKGNVVGVEALARWHHPERGFIPPDHFIPLAEESGLIVPLGDWVLREACRQARVWQDTIPGGVQVAVNISSQQFYQSDLRKTVMSAVFEASVNPGVLQLELTESLLMRDVQETIRTIEYLKSIGVTTALDDFGTGYSSLSYLKRFPLDAIKIDRSFVKDLEANNDDAAICAAIIAMAQRLGLLVIAEGVETEEQMDFLREHGCDQVQGYLLGKPMPAHDFEATLLSTAPSPSGAARA